MQEGARPPLDYAYAPCMARRLDPQLTGWPLSPEGLAFAQRPEHERRPGLEQGQHLPALWPVVPAAGWWGAPTAWLDMHAGLVREVQARRGPCDLLLVGDSLTMEWRRGAGGVDSWAAQLPDVAAVNVGLCGDKVQNVRWRLDHGAVDGLQPRACMLMVGVNNASTVPPTGAGPVARGIEACVRNLRARFPGVPLVLCRLLPAWSPGEAGHEAVRAVNTALDGLQPGRLPGVHVLDLWDGFAQPDGSVRPGLYQPDRLHLSAAGYAALAARLRPLLVRIGALAR